MIKPGFNDEITVLKNRIEELKMFLGIFSMLQLVPYTTDTGSCNNILKLAVKCNQTSVNNLCNMQRDFKHLLDLSSEVVFEIMSNSDE